MTVSQSGLNPFRKQGQSELTGFLIFSEMMKITESINKPSILKRWKIISDQVFTGRKTSRQISISRPFFNKSLEDSLFYFKDFFFFVSIRLSKKKIEYFCLIFSYFILLVYFAHSHPCLSNVIILFHGKYAKKTFLHGLLNDIYYIWTFLHDWLTFLVLKIS